MISVNLKKKIKFLLLPILDRIRGRIIIGFNTKISRLAKIKIINGGSIKIGSNCHIHDYAMLLTYGGDISIGDFCSINPFCVIYGHGGLRLAKV